MRFIKQVGYAYRLENTDTGFEIIKVIKRYGKDEKKQALDDLSCLVRDKKTDDDVSEVNKEFGVDD